VKTIMNGEPGGLLYAGMGAVIAALVSAIGVMWKVLHGNMKSSEERLEKQLNAQDEKLSDCEERHAEKDRWAMDISEKIGELQGVVTGRQQFKEHLVELTGEVIERIENVNATLETVREGVKNLTEEK